MNERTQDEKESFGEIKFSELKNAVGKSKSAYRNPSTFFTEDKADYLLDFYIGSLKKPNELIVKTIDRSRDRFLSEYAKLEAYYEQQKFFSEDGLKERKEKVKLKVFMTQIYSSSST